MGLGLPKFVYKDADAYPYATEIDSVVPEGLILWLLPGLSDIDLARRDFAQGRSLSYTGTPTVDAHYTTGAGNTNYLRSGEIEPTEYTVCAIFKRDDTNADDANRGTVMGSFGGASLPGMIIYWNSATSLRMLAYEATNTQKSIATTPTSPTALHRYTFKCSNTQLELINHTDSVSATPTAFTAARQPGTLPINILSSNSTAYLGDQGIYHLAMWDRVLTSDAINAHWAQMALHTARDGVSVG